MTAAPPFAPAFLVADDEDLFPGASPDLPAEPASRRHSVFEEGEREALRYKWIESERAGRDLGPDALRRWARCHWSAFLRACWLEHLRGQRYWSELDRGDFGLLRRYPHDRPTLLTQILRLLQAGQENLDVILWAHQAGAPIDAVLRILEALDVNGLRLPHRLNC